MRYFLTTIILLACAALSAQSTIPSGGGGGGTQSNGWMTSFGSINGGYQDLANPTIVSSPSAPMGDNDFTADISPAGFVFNYYSVNYTSFRITSNGYLILGNSSASTLTVPTKPSLHLAPGRYISPFWCDIDPSAGGQIGWEFSGNVLSVEWKNMQVVGMAKGIRAKAVLDCRNYEIEMQWGLPGGGLAKYTNWAAQSAVSICSEVSGTMVSFPVVMMSGNLSYGAVVTYPTDRWFHFAPQTVPYTITSPAVLTSGTDGLSYAHDFTVVGGTAPHTFTATGLPSGWSLTSTGALTAPASAVQQGNYAFTVTVVDAASLTQHKQFQVTIEPAALAVTSSATLPSGVDQAAYAHQFTCQNAVGAASWTASGLPTGWSMSTTGLLGAAASEVTYGSYNFSVTVTDSYSTPRMATLNCNVVVDAQKLIVTTTSVGPFTAGTPASAPVSASGGWGALAWTPVSFPNGWDMNTQTGQITASAQYVIAGQYTLYCAVDDQSGQTALGSWVVDVIPPGALTIAGSGSLPSSQPGAAINVHFVATGGVPSYTWSATGLLSGWNVSASGDLTASPQDVVPGTYAFDVEVADSAVPANTDVKHCTLTVAPWPAVVIVPTALADGVIGQPYGEALTVSGGTGGGYSWSLASGSLPPGITAGLGSGPAAGLSGEPTVAGVYSFTLEVKDSAGNFGARQLSITVEAPSLGSEGSGSADSGCAAVVGSSLLWPLLLMGLIVGAALRCRTA